MLVMHDQDGFLRIGEVSRRTGVSPELLRAWERRYGLVAPSRSEGGFRLYSLEDESRIRRMLELIEGGISASQAARLASDVRVEAPSAEPQTAAPLARELTDTLSISILGFDQVGAEAALDRSFAALPEEAVIQRVILPILREIGDGWANGDISVEQEHFASNVIRARLLALGRGWGSNGGRLAVLACLPGELHELGLICLAIALRNRGWGITYLGADTPLASLSSAAKAIRPEVVVVFGNQLDSFGDSAEELRQIAATGRLAIAGHDADEQLAASLPATLLHLDPIASASVL